MTSTNESKSLLERFSITRKAFDDAEDKLDSANKSGTLNEESISKLISNVEELGQKLTEMSNQLDSNVRDNR